MAYPQHTAAGYEPDDEKRAAIQRKARENYGPQTPLAKAEASHSWYEPITATANFLNPLRVVSKTPEKTALPVKQPVPAVTSKPLAAPPAETKTDAPVGGSSTRRRETTQTPTRESVADPMLAEYNRFMNKPDGGIGDAYVAAGFMNKYKALKPFDLKGEEIDQNMAIRRMDSSSPASKARERLYGAQADVAEGAAADAKQKSMLEQRISGLVEGDPARDRLTRLYQMKYGSKDKSGDMATRAKTYSDLVGGGMPEDEARAIAGFSRGGAVEKYADGGQITPYGAPPQQGNPMLAEYGQYLQSAAQAKVPPVPFAQYVNLLSQTRSQMGQTPSQFADGGEVEGEDDMPMGAIDVSGKKLVGPGTERSDSIPAVIDGERPAALSTGEFVIPAHVVRAKGTEFFDKLIAQYANNEGQDNG